MANCQHLLHHRKKKKKGEFQKNIYFYVIDYANAFNFVDHNKLRTILKEMGIPVHLTCLLRNLYADQEAIVRLDMKHQGCILSQYLFNLCAEYVMQNVRLDESQ